MVIRLLPAPVEPPSSSDASAASTNATPANPVAVTTRLVTRGTNASPDDTYVRSTSAGRGSASRSYTTPPRSSQSAGTSSDSGDYVYGSSWAAANTVTPAALYLMYAGISTPENGQLVNVYV